MAEDRAPEAGEGADIADRDLGPFAAGRAGEFVGSMQL